MYEEVNKKMQTQNEDKNIFGREKLHIEIDGNGRGMSVSVFSVSSIIDIS